MADQIYIKEPDGTFAQIDHFPASLEVVPGSDDPIPVYDNYVYTILKTITSKTLDGETSEVSILRTYSNEASAKALVEAYNENINTNRVVVLDQETYLPSREVTKTYSYIKNEFFGEVLEREQTWH